MDVITIKISYPGANGKSTTKAVKNRSLSVKRMLAHQCVPYQHLPKGNFVARPGNDCGMDTYQLSYFGSGSIMPAFCSVCMI